MFRKLSKKELEIFLKKIKEIYDIDENFLQKLKKEYDWYITKQQKVYILEKKTSQVISLINNVKHCGLYVFKVEKDGIRFSIEGSQIFGPYCRKNILNVSKEDKRKWLMGYDLEYKENLEGYVILRSENDFLGGGKVKNGKIINYVPKNRRINI